MSRTTHAYPFWIMSSAGIHGPNPVGPGPSEWRSMDPWSRVVHGPNDLLPRNSSSKTSSRKIEFHVFFSFIWPNSIGPCVGHKKWENDFWGFLGGIMMSYWLWLFYIMPKEIGHYHLHSKHFQFSSKYNLEMKRTVHAMVKPPSIARSWLYRKLNHARTGSWWGSSSFHF